ncbi:MAG: nucleoside monophosphate kinase [Chlamydiota bacterium]
MAQEMVPQFEGKLSVILIFGAPGSGKGTQGKFISYIGNHYHLSSGDIFRGLSPKSTAGKLYHQYASKGELVPDETTVEICRQYIIGLIATNRYFPEKQLLLLDGLPRTKEQAEKLDQYFDVKKIILLDAPDRKVLIDRLTKRARTESRQDDQKTDVLHRRMRAYDEQTLAVLAHYPENLVARFNADQKPLEVLRDILNGLCPILSGEESN